MPIWYHIGLSKEVQRTMNTGWHKCQKTTHKILTVGDLKRWGEDTDPRNREDHNPRRNCKCQVCKTARQRGCTNPHKCGESARTLLRALPSRWNPDVPDPDREITEVHRLHLEEGKDEEIFNPDIVTRKSLGEGFRAFAKADEYDDPPEQMPTWPEEGEPPQEIKVYTDGSCIRNGSIDASAGAGIWCGTEDTRNRAIKLPPHVEHSNNSGEAVAILEAVKDTRPEATLRLITDSKLTMDELTHLLEKHEDEGWLDTANKDIIKTIIDSMRTRTGLTIIRKVKGHSNDEGNDGADELVKTGANKEEPDEVEVKNKWKLTQSGLKLSKATQKLVYRTILNRTPPQGEHQR
ncbi:hypothetical protein H0H92_011121 [Tricholoma furcatifolium]|nr:hypothetical protein H0H92_011121 [Tricholoma furcatifolium]